jgi:hypothetical protein
MVEFLWDNIIFTRSHEHGQYNLTYRKLYLLFSTKIESVKEDCGNVGHTSNLCIFCLRTVLSVYDCHLTGILY